MSRRSFIFWAVMGGAAVALAAETSRLARAERARAEAEARLAGLTLDVNELLTLRAGADRAARGAKPAQDTLDRLTGAMKDAGVPAERLRELARESDEAGTGAYRTLSMRITLDPVTVAELGRVLVAWRAQQLWTPTRIELSHRAGANDESYSARIVMSAAYVSEEQP